MKNVLPKFASAGIFLAAALVTTPLKADDFITIDRKTKVVFTTEEVDGKTVSVATVAVKEVDANGEVTVKQLVEKKVPADGGGAGFDLIVEEIETIATPDTNNAGMFMVRTITRMTTTPVDETGTPGAPVVMPPTDNTETVAEADLDLPDSTSVEIDTDFGDSTPVSGA
ncbi:hypothetical protein [Luteolibacter algae]